MDTSSIAVIFIIIIVMCILFVIIFNGYDVLETLSTYTLSSDKNRPEFYDTEKLPWARYLRIRWIDIRDEMESYIEDRGGFNKIPRYRDIDDEQAPIDNDTQAWRVLMLRLYGRNTVNSKNFPKTMKYLKNAKINVVTAFFSILEPGKIINPHVGPWGGVLKYHLALKTPVEGEAFLDVNGKTKKWKEGSDLMFDDTHVHCACNLSGETRVVLLLEVEREMNTYLETAVNRFLLKVAPHNKTVKQIVEKVKTKES